MSAQIDYRPHYTYRDYEKWEGKWELIQGMPYAMSPAPTYWRQLTTGYIHRELMDALEACSECRPVQAVDWKIDQETVLQPDNMYQIFEAEGYARAGEHPTVPSPLAGEG